MPRPLPAEGAGARGTAGPAADVSLSCGGGPGTVVGGAGAATADGGTLLATGALSAGVESGG